MINFWTYLVLIIIFIIIYYAGYLSDEYEKKFITWYHFKIEEIRENKNFDWKLNLYFFKILNFIVSLLIMIFQFPIMLLTAGLFVFLVLYTLSFSWLE